MRYKLLFVFVSAVILAGADVYGQADQAMQETMKAGQPGKYHTLLTPIVGAWDVAVKMWNPAAPDAQPTESTASAQQEMVLGGRFLHQMFKGTFMGMPFEGFGVMGYDNTKEKYVSAWLDNTSTTIMMTWGKVDAAGKVFTFEGEFTEPTGKTQKMREILRIESPTRQVAEMYMVAPDGKEMKMMELVYTKK